MRQQSAFAKASSDKRAGFTLLELLITLTILGLVLAAVYGALFYTLEVRNQIAEKTAGPRDALALIELMAADFRAAVRPEALESSKEQDADRAPFHGKAARNADGRGRLG